MMGTLQVDDLRSPRLADEISAVSRDLSLK
jgi:hypothetical protein